MGIHLRGRRQELRFRNRRDHTAWSTWISTAPAEIIHALLIDTRPLLRTLLTSRGHPRQRLRHLGGLIAKGWDFLGPTGIERTDAVAACTGVTTGVDAHGFRPCIESPPDVNGVIAIGILRKLFRLRNPGGIHPGVTVVTVDAAMINNFLRGRP